MSPLRYELGFYIPKNGILHSHRCENLKSYIDSVLLHGAGRYIRCKTDSASYYTLGECGPGPEPLWSSGQTSWLQTHRSRILFLALTDLLSSNGSGTGSTQPF
jgi:hypothetical protein